MIWPFHEHDWKELQREYTRQDNASYTGSITRITFQCNYNITHFKTVYVEGHIEKES